MDISKNSDWRKCGSFDAGLMSGHLLSQQSTEIALDQQRFYVALHSGKSVGGLRQPFHILLELRLQGFEDAGVRSEESWVKQLWPAAFSLQVAQGLGGLFPKQSGRNWIGTT